MSRPRILVADDHRIVAEGLRSLLEPKFDLVEIVGDGRQLIEAAKRLVPDVIVADITMPELNGLDALEQLRQSGCKARVVFLTMHKDASYAIRALRAGALGFVLKHSASSELVTAIERSLIGKTYVTPAIAEVLERSSISRSTDVYGDLLLTLRQREVLQLFAEGRSAKEVAHNLHISTRTAENHKARIMKVLGAATTADLVQCAIRHGLIGPT
ncbi:MAG: response regulator transcription factor [Planctomycetota bacterium]